MGRDRQRQYGRGSGNRFGDLIRRLCRWCSYWALVIIASVAHGHGGGLDSSGGHRSGKGYHYHGSPYTPSSTSSSAARGSSYRSSARTAARTTARSYDYRDDIRLEQQRIESLGTDRLRAIEEAEIRAKEIEWRQKEEAEQDMRSQVAAEYHRMAPRYTLHHDTMHPYEAVELLDNGKFWRILLSKGWYVNLEKSRIVRIEPIDCPTGLRTWVDASGAFAIVARLEKIKEPYAQLAAINGRTHTVDVSKLSGVDRRYLRRLLSGIQATPAKYFKGKRMNQVAKAHRFCVLEGRASAEVLKMTKGNKVLDDKQWMYPKSITIAQQGDVDHLLSTAFPPDIWEEINEEKFNSLLSSYF